MTDRKLKCAGDCDCRDRRRSWRRREVARAALLLSLVAGPAFASPAVKAKPAEKDKAAAQSPGGPLRIPLASMGYQPLQQDFLLAGSSMLTVHFVDPDHLLVTFGLRRLMKREADDPAGDADRVIGANLVELPSGKVLAQTEWRVHDRSQYLWPLGHGRFLVRVRDRLTMIAPIASMAAHPAEDAFREYPLLQFDDHIVAILTSPDDDLLTVETTKYAMASGETSEGFSLDPAPVEISFYRLVNKGPAAEELTVVSAGKIRTKTAVALPMTSAGRLEEIEDGKDRWLFNFNEHAGKVDELAGFETTCYPRPTLVGNGEFVAFGCHGGANSVDLAGFNMKGEEMWQQSFYDTHVAPTFVFAPAAGRFALGRMLVSADLDPDMELPPAAVTGQEVRVYQTYNGKQLLKIDCSPVERAGQNFALSPDGAQLAVVREAMVRHAATKDFDAYVQNEAAVEIYSLPPLSAEDLAAAKEAQKLAPADTGARIDMALARTSGSGPKRKEETPEPPSPVAAAAATGGAVAEPAVETPASPAASEAEETAPPAGPVEEGDVQPTGPRKKPTLYGPDDPPDKKPQ
jgi:hypothetical protein